MRVPCREAIAASASPSGGSTGIGDSPRPARAGGQRRGRVAAAAHGGPDVQGRHEVTAPTHQVSESMWVAEFPGRTKDEVASLSVPGGGETVNLARVPARETHDSD